MGILEEAIINRLLETGPSYKRDVMEERIRTLLGAQPFTDVKGLPARRGRADGGIDGILDFRNHDHQAPPMKAALNIKVRISDFTREQLGGFILDMDRESIKVGLIITAAHLSPDAKAELDRKNGEGKIYLYHIRLSDILSQNIDLPDVEINGEKIDLALANNFKRIIEEFEKNS